MRVRDIMNTDVATAEPGTPISQVAALMAARDVGAVVIVEDGKPLGIVTDRDLVLAHLLLLDPVVAPSLSTSPRVV